MTGPSGSSTARGKKRGLEVETEEEYSDLQHDSTEEDDFTEEDGETTSKRQGGKSYRIPKTKRKREAQAAGVTPTYAGVRQKRRMDTNIFKPHGWQHTTAHPEHERIVKDTFAKRETAQLELFKRLCNQVKVLRKVKPTPQTLHAVHTTIESFLLKDPMPGRTYKPHTLETTQEIKTKGGGSVKRFFLGGRNADGDIRWLGGFEHKPPSDQEKTDILRTGCALLNSWPGTLDAISHKTPPKRGLKTMAWDIILYKHNVSAHRTFTDVTFEPGRTRFLMKCNIYNPDTGAAKNFNFTINYKVSELPKTLPPIDPAYRFVKSANQGRDRAGTRSAEESCTPDNLGEEEANRDCIEKFERLARALTVHMDGLVCTPLQASDIAQAFVSQWSSQAHSSHLRKSTGVFGVYEGQKLYQMRCSYRTTELHFVPSRPVKKDLEGTLPIGHLHSHNALWALPAIDELNNQFINTGDIRGAWLKLLEKLMVINERIEAGEPAPSECNCNHNPAQAATITHHCNGCLKTFPCGDLQESSMHLLLCAPCRKEEESAIGGGNYMEKIALNLVDNSVRAEAKHRDGKANRTINKTLQAEIVAVQAKVKSKFAEASLQSSLSWRDDYTGQEHEARPDHSSRDEAISIDASFPYGPDHSQQVLRLHGPANIAFTTRALNYGKSIHLPILLEYLRWYLEKINALDLSDGAGLQQQKSKVQQQMVQACAELRKVRLKAGFTRIARTKGRFDEHRYARDLEQWKTGKLRPADKRADQPWNQVNYVGKFEPQDGLSEEALDRIKKLTAEMMTEFGVDLPERDGVVWFGCETAVPEGYGPRMLSMLANVRFRRMQHVCNGLDETLDDPERMILQCIFIACIVKCVYGEGEHKLFNEAQVKYMQERYKDFLELPLVADMFDPLCFAITHVDHGHPMYTGFAPNPTSLQDRDETYSNTSMESRVSNFLKHNFHSNAIPRIKRDILKVKFSQGFMEGTILSDLNKSEEDDLSSIDPTEALKIVNDTMVISVDDFEAEDAKAEDAEPQDEEVEDGADMAEAGRLDEKFEAVLDQLDALGMLGLPKVEDAVAAYTKATSDWIDTAACQTAIEFLEELMAKQQAE